MCRAKVTLSNWAKSFCPISVLSFNNSLRSDKVLSFQKKLSLCPYGLHQSWAPFPALKYKRVVVSIAYVAPNGEMLLKQGDDGMCELPSECFAIGNLLLSSPGRVIAREFGFEPQMLLDVRLARQVKVLGMQSEEGGDYDVLMTAPVSYLKRLQGLYFKDYSELMSRVHDIDSPVFVAAKALGWPQPEIVTI
jgi:hypothetical protein